jgi:hypothetical protein
VVSLRGIEGQGCRLELAQEFNDPLGTGDPQRAVLLLVLLPVTFLYWVEKLVYIR